jgi:hypothetical protein
LIRQVAEAGWEPVTDATCDIASVLVERFGPTPEGTSYYTLFNDGLGYARGVFTLTSEPIAPQSSRRATELLSGQQLPWTGRGWAFAVDSQSVAVVRIDPPARFLRVEVDPERHLRLTVEAALGSEQVLEGSTNLHDWTSVRTNLISAVPMELLGEILADGAREYFRLRFAPVE